MSGPALHLLVFDARRGNNEGSEQDKVLGCYPATTRAGEQTALAGLLHGLVLFCSNFTHGDAWDFAETDHALWTLFHAEPSVYFAATAAKAWLPRHVAQDNLRALLAHAHQLLLLLHGGVQALLDQDESGVAARRVIGEVLTHLAEQLSSPASWASRELRNPLARLGATATLHSPLHVSLAVQSFCNGLLLGGGDGPAVAEVVVLYQSMVLWTSLGAEDTAAVYSLVATAFLQPAASKLPENPPVLNGDCWQQLSSGFIVLRGLDGGAGLGTACTLPTLHISGGRVHRLLPFSEGRMLVLALLPRSVVGSEAELAGVHCALGAPARRLAAQLSEEFKANRSEPGHVPGCRYVTYDPAARSVRATPRVKVSAMSHHARALVTALTDSLSRHGVGAPPAGPDANHERPATPASEAGSEATRAGGHGVQEVWAKSSQDVWALVRCDACSQRQLLLVREKRAERTLGDSLLILDALACSLEQGSPEKF